jgi:hypothetical protein
MAWLIGAIAWLALATWHLGSAPGLSMDEAWSVLSARGQWAADNPLSGMTSYAGPFPVLLLRLFGTGSSLLVLRGASVVANAIMLVLLGRILARLDPQGRLRGWGLALVASLPLLLVLLRDGIEVCMFTPPLAVLGLYLFLQQRPWAAFGAGLAWGVLVYNHLIGACVPIGLAVAWLIVYRRLPPIAWRPALAGFALGVAPRVVAIALYHKPLAGGAATYNPLTALVDLVWLPAALWESLDGRAVYLRYVGRVAFFIVPYWLLAIDLWWPWRGRWRELPEAVRFTLWAALAASAVATVMAPYQAVRFMIVPVVGLATFVVLLGVATSERDPQRTWRVRLVVAALTAGNLLYLAGNFYVPWARNELAITTSFFGWRSARTTSHEYLPKEALELQLRALSPLPAQIISKHSLVRPLRVLLNDLPTRCVVAEEADQTLPSIYLDYRTADLPPRVCLGSAGAPCFDRPRPLDPFYVLYRQEGR